MIVFVYENVTYRTTLRVCILYFAGFLFRNKGCWNQIYKLVSYIDNFYQLIGLNQI